jgi:thiamine-phosphate pyrophosphorylase
MAQSTATVRLGVDYISVGPIFATNTKKDVSAPVGLEYLEYVVENIRLHFVALG